jgi:hypothetical protein
LDIEGHKKLNTTPPKEFFVYQMELIRIASNNNTVVLGDFNLDLNKKGLQNYPFASYFECLDNAFERINVVQLVDFTTWSRQVSGVVRVSVLDHVYASDPTLLTNLSGIKPIFGDHCMVQFKYAAGRPVVKTTIKINWMRYEKELLLELLREVDWNIASDGVQGCWNKIENKLIKIVDKLAPLQEFKNNSSIKTKIIPRDIKSLINRRKNLLHKQKTNNTQPTRDEIKRMDYKIKKFFNTRRSNEVIRSIILGNSASLWKAVKIARDVNHATLPGTLYENGIEIRNEKLADHFAGFF